MYPTHSEPQVLGRGSSVPILVTSNFAKGNHDIANLNRSNGHWTQVGEDASDARGDWWGRLKARGRLGWVGRWVRGGGGAHG